jgi:plasmid stabilization system protein ParE
VADLFAREFETARRIILDSPELGTPYVKRHGVFVRRILLPKTQNLVYYELRRDEGVVMILAVWGAPRGRGPKL